jgi:hypothetical protein
MRAGAMIEEEDSMLSLRRFTETAIAAIAIGLLDLLNRV